MKKLGQISTMAIILFLVMSIPQFIEKSLFKVQLMAGLCFFLLLNLIITKFKSSKKRRRGLLKG